MAYQPLYAWVDDNQGGKGHTLSLRGKVDRTGAYVNTYDGKAISVESGYVDGEEKAYRPDLRTIPKEQRDLVREEYKKEVEEKTRYYHDISISTNLDHDFSINGYILTKEDQKAMTKGLVSNKLPQSLRRKGIFALAEEIINLNPKQRSHILKLLGL